MLIKTFRFMTPQAVMDAVFGTFVGTLKFLQLSISLRINFLGLLVSAFLIGFLTGVICCAYLILWTYGFRLPSPFAERPSSQPAQRLVRYLNEHSNLLSRGRWTWVSLSWTCHDLAGSSFPSCWLHPHLKLWPTLAHPQLWVSQWVVDLITCGANASPEGNPIFGMKEEVVLYNMHTFPAPKSTPLKELRTCQEYPRLPKPMQTLGKMKPSHSCRGS